MADLTEAQDSRPSPTGLDWARIRDFCSRSGLRPAYLALPVFLAMGAALFEGLTMSLLLPLARGILQMNSSFSRDLPAFDGLLGELIRRFDLRPRVAFLSLVAMVFLCSVAKNVLQYISVLSVAREVRRFSNNLRQLLMRRMLSFGKLYFDRNSIGYLHSVVTGFTSTVAFRLTDLQQIFNWAFMLLAYLVVMAAISVKLTLLVLLLFPALHLSFRWIIERLKTTSGSYAEAQSSLARRLYNTLTSIVLVKAYTREREEAELFGRESDAVGRLEFSLDKKLNILSPIQEIAVLAVMLVMIGFTAFVAIRKGPAGLSGLLIFFFLLKRSTVAFGILNNIRAVFASASGPLNEILWVLDDRDKHFAANGERAFEGLRERVEFRDLSFSFDKAVPVLRNLNLRVEKGKMTAIVGPTGSGKTTLINLLMRFYEPPPGTLLVDGMDIREFSLRSLRSRIALVGQDAMIFNDTLAANMGYGLDGAGREALLEAGRKARLGDFIKRLPRGLDTVVGDHGVQLSGGEKQRLSIARAILKEAPILILDEATSSLDSQTERLIQEAIQEMVEGRTAVVIAHRLSTIRRADWIAFVEDGHVAEEGTLESLLASGGRFRLQWESQRFL